MNPLLLPKAKSQKLDLTVPHHDAKSAFMAKAQVSPADLDQ
jgi:hypothetical protein